MATAKKETGVPAAPGKAAKDADQSSLPDAQEAIDQANRDKEEALRIAEQAKAEAAAAREALEKAQQQAEEKEQAAKVAARQFREDESFQEVFYGQKQKPVRFIQNHNCFGADKEFIGTEKELFGADQ